MLAWQLTRKLTYRRRATITKVQSSVERSTLLVGQCFTLIALRGKARVGFPKKLHLSRMSQLPLFGSSVCSLIT